MLSADQGKIQTIALVRDFLQSSGFCRALAELDRELLDWDSNLNWSEVGPATTPAAVRLESGKASFTLPPLQVVVDDYVARTSAAWNAAHSSSAERNLAQASFQRVEPLFSSEPLQRLESIHKSNILVSKLVDLPRRLFAAQGPSGNLGDEPSESTVRVVVTASTDKIVKISDTQTGAVLWSFEYPKGSVLDVELDCDEPGWLERRDDAGADADGSDKSRSTSVYRLVLAGMDGLVHIVDIATRTIVQTLEPHSKYVTAVKVVESKGEFFVVTGSHDKTVKIYRRTGAGASPGASECNKMQQQQQQQHYRQSLYSLVHSVEFQGAVECMCLVPPEQEEPPAPQDSLETAQATHSVAACQDEETQQHHRRRLGCWSIAVGCRDDNYLHYIDLDSSTGFRQHRYNLNANGDDWVSFSPMCLALSPSGRHLACYTDTASGRILVLGARSAVQVQSLWGIAIDPMFAQPRCIFDPSGNFVLATADDHAIWAYNIASGQCVRKMLGHTSTIRGLHRLGDSWASCSFDKSVLLWGSVATINP
ncbi:WD40-repeat-containing domain protein [Polychytrium aggregatum]|uniref:WD40-repeat-containing domain protein n=1 Tax=Polychytrium aggregatum TaxID=110093 RepID=UPI0022FDDA31|nr:WD40-repeat-containing domain protein [Polychytrium aggregatum]KAI9193476.1 WD40-repeat-containing domain protein [Polychytrium aggregatum]